VTDWHIHTGQFRELLYPPALVLETVFQAGTDTAFFSSTTTCREGVRYAEVEQELAEALRRSPPDRAKALLWYVPAYAAQGVSVEHAFASLPYAGLKLHPRAQCWNLSDAGHLDILHALFDAADRQSMPALIHTGPDTQDEAGLFGAFFAEYPNVRFILAHARPLEQTLRLMAAHANVYCDTAFVPKTHIRRIVAAGFAEKILAGSDFPITHYRAGRRCSLREQYKRDQRMFALVAAL